MAATTGTFAGSSTPTVTATRDGTSSAFFDIALRGRASAQPTPWMIGDHAENDIDGGRRAGCRTGWVSHGGAWAEGPPPTVAAETTLGVLDAIAARRDGR